MMDWYDDLSWWFFTSLLCRRRYGVEIVDVEHDDRFINVKTKKHGWYSREVGRRVWRDFDGNNELFSVPSFCLELEAQLEENL
jgi:hypothetical protein